MAGRIALVGGDEFRAICAGMDAELLAATGVAKPRVVVVPTAAAMERPELAAANGARHFNALGADAKPLMVLTADDANDAALVAAADAADVIYLTGGNPAYLMGALAGSRLAEALRAALCRGAIVAGSSAGAMALGERMRFRGEWSAGLGLARGIAVLPHHERSDPERVAAELAGALPAGVTALGIDGATGCVSEGAGWRALGAGKVARYRAGAWARFGAGEVFGV